MPNNESMAAIALVAAAGGAIKSSKTTVLMTGDQGVEALNKAGAVAGASGSPRGTPPWDISAPKSSSTIQL